MSKAFRKALPASVVEALKDADFWYARAEFAAEREFKGPERHADDPEPESFEWGSQAIRYYRKASLHNLIAVCRLLDGEDYERDLAILRFE